MRPDLSTASSVLRIANSIPSILDANECRVDGDIDGKQILDDFYNLLLEVEEDVRSTPIGQRYDNDNAFVIAIEGLDGCGKR